MTDIPYARWRSYWSSREVEEALYRYRNQEAEKQMRDRFIRSGGREIPSMWKLRADELADRVHGPLRRRKTADRLALRLGRPSLAELARQRHRREVAACLTASVYPAPHPGPPNLSRLVDYGRVDWAKVLVG